MESIRLFNFIFYEFLQTLAIFCGANIFLRDYKLSWSGRFMFMSCVFGFICTCYTIYLYDLDTKLQCATMLIFSIQGCFKFYTVHINSVAIRETVEFLGCIYVANKANIFSESTTLIKWSLRFVQIVKMIAIIFVTSGLVCFLIPIIIYFTSGVRTPIAPVYIPFIDETTNFGFGIITVVHLIWNAQVVLGLIAADSLLAMFIMYMFLMVELFENLFNDVNYELNKNPKIGKSAEMFKCVKTLVEMHQEMCTYMESVIDIFAVVCFVDLNSNAFGLCFIIFNLIVLEETWYALYAICVAVFGKLFLICVLGTLCEVATDRLLDVIQRSKWYLFPTTLQANIQIMLQRAQNPTIMIAGTTPLNLDTFVNAMKSVYSVAMIMGEMIE